MPPRRASSAAAVAGWVLLAIVAGGAWWWWPASIPRRWLLVAAIAGAAVGARTLHGRGAARRLWNACLARLPGPLRYLVPAAAVALVCWRLVRWPDATGAWFLLVSGTGVAALAAGAAGAVAWWRRAARPSLAAAAAAVAAGVVTLALTGVEVALGFMAPLHGPTAPLAAADVGDPSSVPAALLATLPVEPSVAAEAERRRQVLMMPESWRRQELMLPGAAHAYRWHEVVHASDAAGVRLPEVEARAEAGAAGAGAAGGDAGAAADPGAGPGSAPGPAAARILLVGDSYTWGMGVHARHRYGDVLERLLRAEGYDVEVVNEGVCSHQSRNVLERLPEALARVKPAVVIYGICLNDFLPSGVDVYDRAWHLPRWLQERARVLELLDGGAVQAQMALGVATDFYQDILRDFGACQARFREDVTAMNALVTSAGLPPMVALVLDNFPDPGGPGARIAAVADAACRDAGMRVVDRSDYDRRFAGLRMPVSRWECHPNEVAHAAWADLLRRELTQPGRLPPECRR